MVFDMGGLLGAVTDVMESVDTAVDKQLIDQLVTMLDQTEQALKEQRLESVAASHVGGSSAGARFAHHAGLARDKVEEIVADLGDGLGQYAKALRRYQDDQEETDQQNAEVLRKIQGLTTEIQDNRIVDGGATGGQA